MRLRISLGFDYTQKLDKITKSMIYSLRSKEYIMQNINSPMVSRLARVYLVIGAFLCKWCWKKKLTVNIFRHIISIENREAN